MRLNTVARKFRGVELDKDIELTVRKRQTNSLGRFQAIGQLSTEEHQSEFDLLEAVVSLPAGAQKLFLCGQRSRCPKTNIVYRHQPPDQPSEYKIYRRNCKFVMDAGLAAQLKRPLIRKYGLDDVPEWNTRSLVFMINPFYIRCRDFGNARLMWREITDTAIS